MNAIAITHPGQAHADDVLTAAYLIAKGLVQRIDRRDPTREELMDDAVIVFDIGGQHSPDASNFDHHQFDRDVAPSCALSLVLRFFGDYTTWRTIFPWVEGTELMDSKGPFTVAKSLGVDFDDLKPFVFNPFAGFVLEQFQNQSVHVAGEPTFELLRSIGAGLLAKVDTIRERWAHFDSTTRIVTVRDCINVAVFDTTGRVGIESWIESQMRHLPIHCTVSRDDRGDGLSLFRRNDDQRIDFSKCAGLPNVAFAHANGFVAKITDHDWMPVVDAATRCTA